MRSIPFINLSKPIREVRPSGASAVRLEMFDYGEVRWSEKMDIGELREICELLGLDPGPTVSTIKVSHVIAASKDPRAIYTGTKHSLGAPVHNAPKADSELPGEGEGEVPEEIDPVSNVSDALSAIGVSIPDSEVTESVSEAIVVEDAPEAESAPVVEEPAPEDVPVEAAVVETPSVSEESVVEPKPAKKRGRKRRVDETSEF